MANRSDDKKKVRCSFCNKSQEQVRKLIAGPNVYICDECIEICSGTDAPGNAQAACLQVPLHQHFPERPAFPCTPQSGKVLSHAQSSM